MSAVLSYELLGPVRVRRDGREIDLGSPKQHAVLAALLLEAGRVVSVDRLVDAVWGDDPPAATAASLQAYVSNLRKALRDPDRPSSPIVRRAPGYLIDIGPTDLDLIRFVTCCDTTHRLVRDQHWSDAVEAAEQALGEWRGPLVQDFADEEWVAVVAPGYVERRLVCEQDVTTALLAIGRDVEALARTTELHADNPLDEKACWLHVMALHRVGRTAEALAVLRDFGRTLDEELGLEIGPALRDLQGAILRQDVELERWPRTASDDATRPPTVVEPAAPTAGPVITASSSDPSPLIGREREMATLERAWASTAQSASWVAITGPAGIGKTRLGEGATRLALERGWRVARVSCPDDPDLPAWWPLRQLLRELDVDPELVLGDVESPLGSKVELTRFTVYERLESLLRSLAAENAVLLVLDDVHWSDASTLGLLTHLAETMRTAGVAVLLTARDELENGDGARLLAALARRDAPRLALPPLSPTEVAALVEQVSGEAADPHELTDLVERTGGNAFFVAECARLPRSERHADVPRAVRAVTERRLATLSTDILVVLRAAAVMGEPLDLGVLRDVLGLDADTLADLLDQAADAEIIAPDDTTGGYAFGHALLRETLLTGLSTLRRAPLHLRIAEALEQRRDTDSLSRRAQHLLAAGDEAAPGVLVEACRAIAIDADQRWDSREAARWWEQALAAHDRDPAAAGADREQLVVSFLAALVRAGQGQRMLDVVDSSLLEAWREGRTSSIGVVASMLLRLTGAWPWPAYGSDPGALMSRLAGLEGQLHDHPAAHARVLAALAIGSCYDLDPDVPDTLSRRAIEIATGTGADDVLADALLGRAMTYAGVAERAEETIGLVEQLSRTAHRLERFDEVIGHGIASMATVVLGDLAGTIRHLQEGAERADALRLPVSRAQLRWGENLLATWRTDDVAAMETLVDQAYLQHQQTELTQSVTVVLARLCLRWEQGRLAEGLGIEVDNPFLAPWIDAAVAVARRDPMAGAALAREVRRREPTVWTSHGRLTLLSHALADHLGSEPADKDVVDADELSALLIPQLERLSGTLAGVGHCGVLGPVDLARARLLLVRGDVDAARTALGDALALSMRARGDNWVVRCRAQAHVMDAAVGGARDLEAIVGLREEALRRGLLGVAGELSALVART